MFPTGVAHSMFPTGVAHRGDKHPAAVQANQTVCMVGLARLLRVVLPARTSVAVSLTNVHSLLRDEMFANKAPQSLMHPHMRSGPPAVLARTKGCVRPSATAWVSETQPRTNRMAECIRGKQQT